MNFWKQIEAAEATLRRETGVIQKDHGGRLTIGLAYPNSYYVGMSSLALQILYRTFNACPDVVCERMFWHPDEVKDDLPLISLESQTDAAAFDVLAFTISFEMDYFNVVAMLRQAGIPPLSEERMRDVDVDGRPQWPLLIAGGPAVTMNPEPLAPFFDAFVIGEAEEVIGPLVDVLSDIDGACGHRDRLLDELDRLPGIYVPARLAPSPGGRRIDRRWVADVSRIEPVSTLYTPDTEFSGMHLLEIARGCGRGCRYCLAGYLYRPVREQPIDRVLGWARAALASGVKVEGRPLGIGLVSAAVSDYTAIDELATELQGMGARLTVSSMRTDPISVPLIKAMAASGTQTLTIAPEAGSERLRKAINKPQDEDTLLAAVELAQGLNFPQLKMYFMIGHPGETQADIEGIVDLTLKAKKLFRRNIAINATPFVPKAHTPFASSAMAPAKTIEERQKYLSRTLAAHKVRVNADSPAWAEVQGVLARGDRRLAPVLLDAVSGSPRHFHAALAAHGLDAGMFLSARGPADFAPWHVIDTGVDDAFLQREAALAEAGRRGMRCPPGSTKCGVCGVCVDTETVPTTNYGNE